MMWINIEVNMENTLPNIRGSAKINKVRKLKL